jgi:hypothetical protein
MITVIIPYMGNKVGLTQLLVSLQPQLHPDDDIYVVDSSLDRSAVKLVKAYGANRCYIFVEVTDKIGRDAIQYGLQSMKENKQDGALILAENSVISSTFIANLKKAAAHKEWGILIPAVSEVIDGIMDANFKWFCPPTTEIKLVNENEEKLSRAALYIKASEINDDFTMDYYRDLRVGRFENEMVVFL